MHYNEIAEMAAIGSLLRDKELIKETKLRKEHFYYENGEIIFAAIKAVSDRGEPVDTVSVFSELTKREQLETIGGISVLTDLENGRLGGWTSFENSENLVIDCWKRRQAIDLVTSFKMSINDSKEADEINDLIKHLQTVIETGLDAESNTEARLEHWYNDRVSRKPGMIGLTTGYTDLDKAIGGYRDECLYILAARPAVGKTALMLCSALKTAAKGATTVIFSLEMSTEQLFDRMACALAGINSYKLECPNEQFTEQDWKAFNAALGRLHELVRDGLLVIYDKPGTTIQEIRSKLRMLRRKYPNRKIICMLDYLQLVRSTNKHKERRLEVSEVSGNLKEICRQAKMPILALAQLSREVEKRQEKRPMMSDLKESSDIEADADAIFMLYREEYHNPETERKNIVELIIAKNRHGATGTVELVFLKEFSRYINHERGHENGNIR